MCWRAAVPKVPYPSGIRPEKRPVVRLRLVRCLYLLKRMEFRAGCGGMTCRHDCAKGLPAVPGTYCQTCPDYEADAGPWV